MVALYLLKCDACGRTTLPYADEARMWEQLWTDGWMVTSGQAKHVCVDCKKRLKQG